jgi:hypothetical protein
MNPVENESTAVTMGYVSEDVNGDGIVDALDFIYTDNAASQMSVGYLPTDANGDGSVNSTDIGLIDQNASTFVGAVTP